MKYSENRKITACVTRDGGTRSRGRTFGRSFVARFYFCNVSAGDNSCFFFFFKICLSFNFKMSPLFDSQRKTHTRCKSDINYYSRLKKKKKKKKKHFSGLLSLFAPALFYSWLKVFSLLLCYGTERSPSCHHVQTGDPSSLLTFHTITKISPWDSVARTASPNWIKLH